ncbi:hypothetical protein OsI_28242 [Oryza sativa Indica Group]|uniref:Uncharacterized protein n=1 Tax=Oryza sativa subsp. indica TaxID=39946 RepID=A2YSD5_ORYSI|nr:hypothetical protein OsI_28242 [Oryza sativa Indica Group]
MEGAPAASGSGGKGSARSRRLTPPRLGLPAADPFLFRSRHTGQNGSFIERHNAQLISITFHFHLSDDDFSRKSTEEFS